MTQFKPSDKRITFAILAVEMAAKRLGVSPAEVYKRLEKAGLIRPLLYDSYDTLHTQSSGYVGDFVADALLNHEKRN